MLHLETIKAVIDAAEKARIPYTLTIKDEVERSGFREERFYIIDADRFIDLLTNALEDDAVNQGE